VATGLGITVGYHRLFAHATYKANSLVQFLLLFFGAAAFEQSTLKWASQHRDHHRYVDTDRDPYNIKKGFFYAHIGWLMFWDHVIDYDNAKDLQKNPLVAHQHRHYYAWAVGAGIVTPLLIGLLTGHLLGALIFAVCFRLTFVYHATFCINSVCHMFGKATYDIYSSAKDHWFVALLTFGEGYHNFHHRFPSDYRNAIRWYQWDPSKWLIALMSKMGLTWDLKKVSAFRILEARLAGESLRVADGLNGIGNYPQLQKAKDLFNLQYQILKQHLIHWETAVKEYRALLCENVGRQSRQLHEAALENVRAAKGKFTQLHNRWTLLIQYHPLELQNLLLLTPIH
jgi:stearoyl-CoA desaturase (delta-9 desaturase)